MKATKEWGAETPLIYSIWDGRMGQYFDKKYFLCGNCGYDILLTFGGKRYCGVCGIERRINWC